MQAQYFDELVHTKESTIEYSELYYQSENKKKDAISFEQFGTIADLF